MTDDEQRLKELRDLTWSDRMEGVGEYLVNRFEKRVADYRAIVKPLGWETEDGIGFMSTNPYSWCSVIGGKGKAMAFHCGVMVGEFDTVDAAKAALGTIWVDRILAAIWEGKGND
tara:strand:+ start:4041 stop:4385 length:345 start_codon:yes stop_codon:yes gene_type:complete